MKTLPFLFLTVSLLLGATFKAQAATFTFYGPVTAESVSTLVDEVSRAGDAGDKNIEVKFDSPGGDLVAAVTAFPVLQRYAIHSYASGECASACTVLFASGAIRSASNVTKFLFHGVKVAIKGGTKTDDERKETEQQDIQEYAQHWADAVRSVAPTLADELEKDHILIDGSREYPAYELRKSGYINN